ncbi:MULTISPECIES: ABC transporter ATP-binding protein [Cyanophyceae]|uniref:ABC transporter ATP-binding protein n=1 Tax=Leptolyngbya subtilissima DQ-A4 TaxID=2933933 RepID=A0ABV0KD55_9CYAN|nr:ABC transporter ATP-binding protein [Nodosilinea sp. FACHB-141]MBD2111798.1 ABC transporter ATP-binding protein [Nodosilinea sp. FACHB-141]
MAFSSRTTSPVTTQSPSLSQDVVVALRDINLHFGHGAQRVEALQNINLDLIAGDFVCVLGSSGCGKTSLLRVLAGYQPPTAGAVYIGGKSHSAPTAEVGVVFQRPNLLPWLSIADNVGFGPKMQGEPDFTLRQRVAYYLDLVGLTEASQRLPHQLSGGMQQRAAIARTLAATPRVVLMDEPFGALDALTRELMQMHLHKIWQQTQKTIFFITHDVEEAMILATRIVVMHAHPGRIVQQISNPFRDVLKSMSISDLRTMPEFIRLRQRLVSAIHSVEGG